MARIRPSIPKKKKKPEFRKEFSIKSIKTMKGEEAAKKAQKQKEAVFEEKQEVAVEKKEKKEKAERPGVLEKLRDIPFIAERRRKEEQIMPREQIERQKKGVVTGLAIGAAGAVVAGAAGATAAGVTAKGGVKAVRSAAFKKVSAQSINKVATMFGKDSGYIKKIVNRKLLSQATNKIVNRMNPYTLASRTGKWLLGKALLVAGADVLMSWYALDNVLTGQKFFVKDIGEAVEVGAITPKQARASIEKAEDTRTLAKGFITTSTTINPLLWPFRNLLLTGVEGEDEAIETAKEIVESQIEAAEQGVTNED